MMPPKIQLQGKLFSLNAPDVSQDSSAVVFGYIVTGSEKDLMAAYIVVRVSRTTLSGWTGLKPLLPDEANAKFKTIISTVLPYINLPVSLDEIREKYPHGLTINFYSDDRRGFIKDDFAFYVEHSSNPEELVKRIVYNGEITQDKIEDRLLHTLDWYREWDFTNQQPNPSTAKGEMFYPDLLESSFISKAQVELALDVMSQEGLVEVRSVDQGIVAVKIKATGIRKVAVTLETTPKAMSNDKTIFYSWQNTVKPNRKYIQDCLEKAIEGQDGYSIDTATRGVKGSPDIPETILEKIKACDIFVADVSIINKDYDGIKTSNPNVLYELGYAASEKGYENIILVASRETTDTKELPFDIRNKTIVMSNFNETSKPQFIKMLQDELAIHTSEVKSQEPLEHPYIFINGSKIHKQPNQEQFDVNIYNDEADSYHLDSVEIDGITCKVDRSLKPKDTTTNVNIPNAPIPPYINRVSMLIMNISKGSKSYKIKQNIKVIDMATGQYDISGWEEKPSLIVENKL